MHVLNIEDSGDGCLFDFLFTISSSGTHLMLTNDIIVITNYFDSDQRRDAE